MWAGKGVTARPLSSVNCSSTSPRMMTHWLSLSCLTFTLFELRNIVGLLLFMTSTNPPKIYLWYVLWGQVLGCENLISSFVWPQVLSQLFHALYKWPTNFFFYFFTICLQLPSFSFSVPLALFHLSEGVNHPIGGDKRDTNRAAFLVSIYSWSALFINQVIT